MNEESLRGSGYESRSQAMRQVAIAEKYRQFMAFICKELPPSRERSLALTKLEESCLWAKEHITRNPSES